MGAGGEGGAQRQREFRDVAGHRWVAVERPFPAAEWTAADEESARAGFGAGWLCFTSGSAPPLRLRLYPVSWVRLNDEALETLRSKARKCASAE